jgi:cysteine-rich repeat protein
LYDIYATNIEKFVKNYDWWSQSSICWDGIKNDGEKCDDWNTKDWDGCSSICMIEVEGSVCGDGKVAGDEGCDDGNTTNWDGCDKSCKIEEVFVCWDGKVGWSEGCDDGNTIDWDGCDKSCMIEWIYGCMDGSAMNYNSSATKDDWKCEYDKK